MGPRRPRCVTIYHVKILCRPVAIAVLLGLLTGCSSATHGVSGRASTPAAASPSATGSARSAPASTSKQRETADSLLAKLRAAGLPITSIAEVSAAGDPNHLLGRPNGYLSKVTFGDSRIRAADVSDPSAGSVDLGGAVETYGNPQDARGRMTYVQATLKANPVLGTEYDFVVGDSVLRLSSALTPQQAQQYATAAQ